MFPFGVRAKTLTAFYRQLATMYDAGLSITRSLDTLMAQPGSSQLKKALREMRASIGDGATLAEAFAEQSSVFPEMHASIIAAGEIGGSLHISLTSLADLLERTIAFRRKLISGLIYPLLLIHAAVAIILIARTIAESTKEMFTSNPIWMLVGLYGAVFVFAVLRKVLPAMALVATALEQILVAMPIVGKLWLNAKLARFTCFLATMHRAGLPIMDALEAAGKSSGSRLVDRAARYVASQVREGETLTEALESSRFFPPMLVNMVATGEEGGKMDEMLDKISDYYQGQAETALDALTKIVPFAIYICVAIYMASLIIGAYTQLFSRTGVIR